MLQLIFTSTPRGLIQARSGFTTVAMTNGFPMNLVPLVENLGAYERVYAPDHPHADRNPVNYRYSQQKLGNQLYCVLSKIQFNGPGYSRRGAPIASHVLLTPEEFLDMDGKAVEALACDGNFSWSGQVEYLPMERKIQFSQAGGRDGATWKRLFGHEEWAQVMAWRFRHQRATKPVFLEFDPLKVSSQELLCLVGEVAAWLTPQERLEFTFTTYCYQSSLGNAAFIRAYPMDSQFLGSIRRFSADSIWRVGEPRELSDMYQEEVAFMKLEDSQAAHRVNMPPRRVQTDKEIPLTPLTTPSSAPRQRRRDDTFSTSMSSSSTVVSSIVRHDKRPAGIRPWALVAMGAGIAFVSMLAALMVFYVLFGPREREKAEPRPPVVDTRENPDAGVEKTPVGNDITAVAVTGHQAEPQKAAVRDSEKESASRRIEEHKEPETAQIEDIDVKQDESEKKEETTDKGPQKASDLKEWVDCDGAIELPDNWAAEAENDYGKIETRSSSKMVQGTKAQDAYIVYNPSDSILKLVEQKKIEAISIKVYGRDKKLTLYGLGAGTLKEENMYPVEDWRTLVTDIHKYIARRQEAQDKENKSYFNFVKNSRKKAQNLLESFYASRMEDSIFCLTLELRTKEAQIQTEEMRKNSTQLLKQEKRKLEEKIEFLEEYKRLLEKMECNEKKEKEKREKKGKEEKKIELPEKASELTETTKKDIKKIYDDLQEAYRSLKDMAKERDKKINGDYLKAVLEVIGKPRMAHDNCGCLKCFFERKLVDANGTCEKEFKRLEKDMASHFPALSKAVADKKIELKDITRLKEDWYDKKPVVTITPKKY